MMKSLRFIYLMFLIIILSACSRKVFVVSHHTDPTKKHVPCSTQIYANKEVIILDPGHGGEDLGTCSLISPKYQEKHLTLSTSILLKNYLEQMGYQVIMTRSKDVYIHKDDRAAFANDTDGDIFVSIHYNSAPNKQAKGIEIFYYKSKEEKERSDLSHSLASSILNRMLEQTEAKSRGVKHGSLAVVRQTKMPAVLVEGGFLTNEEEMVKLKTGSYLKKIAWGMAQGIDDYLASSRSSGG